MKLSKKQKEVIALMRKGWVCGTRGLDNGRQFKRVPANTHESLVKLKLIENAPFSVFAYQLTSIGKSIPL